MKRFLFAVIVLSSFAFYGIAMGQSLDFVGSVSTPVGANTVVVNGSYAYVSIYSFGLQIVDVSDPANPAIAGSYDTPDMAMDVFILGDYAYVADYTSLQIINISNSANPTLTGSFELPRECWGVYVINNYAYLANGYYGLRVLNISDPTTPVEVGLIAITGGAQDLVVQGAYAYVISNIVEPYTSFLRVVDISDPGNMQIVGGSDTMPGFWSLDIKIAGQYLYIANSDGGLQIFDISNPTNPLHLGSNISAGVNGVFIDGYHVFTADGYRGIHLSNILDPFNFIPLCGYDTPGTAQGVCYADSFIYVADNYSLQIFHLNGECHYVVGDLNGNGQFNGLDVVFAVLSFRGNKSIYSCECPAPNAWHVAGDVNGSCNFDGIDVTYMVNYFKGGSAPMPCPDCPPAGTSRR